jgi:hypothetical protein
MSLTRRRFIEAASLTLLASTARPLALAQSISGSDRGTFCAEDVAVLNSLSEETFQAMIGESFAVLQGNRRLEYLTLLSVTSAATPKLESRLPRAGAPSRLPEQAIHSFSLHFQTSGRSLGQGTYTLNNESLGSFPLFFVPGGPGMSPNSYTATFSLLVL